MSTSEILADSQFWSNVSSNLLGVVLGSIFTYLLYRLEVKHRETKEKSDSKLLKISILNHTMISGAANLETLINFKKQIVFPLIEDIDKFRPSVVSGEIKRAIEAASTLKHLFHTLPNIIFVPMPEYRDMMSFSDEAPSIVYFSARSSETFSLLNNYVDVHNSIIRRIIEYSSTGAPPQKYLSDYKLLVSSSASVITGIDDALFFSKILLDQTENYLANKFKGSKSVKIKIPKERLEFVPKIDYIPGIASQFKDFSQAKE